MTVTFEELRERAKPWTEPIPGPRPGGTAAKLDLAYQLVASEAAKVDMPASQPINWKSVAEGAGSLLTNRTKDLFLASYMAHALHRMGGLDGLTTGITLVAEVIDRYWETLFPEARRIRGRANALQWFVEKSSPILPTSVLPLSELERIRNLDTAAKRLAQVVRERFADAAPSVTPLLEPIEQMRLTVEATAKPPTPPAPSPAASPAPGSTDSAPATASATPANESTALPTPPVPQATPPTPAESRVPAMRPPPAPPASGDMTTFLRDIGESLVTAAAKMRRDNLSNPAAYRVLRAGLWLGLSVPPPSKAGKIAISSPPDDLKKKLAALIDEEEWAGVVEEAELALGGNRFALDLHRISWQALAALGADFERARETLAVEMRAFLGRMPRLPSLAFCDGTPLADPQTRSWLEDEIAPKAAASRCIGAGSADEARASGLAEARKLIGSNKPAEALAVLQSLVAGSPAGRQRFVARLDFARLCVSGGLLPVAQAIYEELEREATAHQLDEWEPDLAAECLKGFILAVRALAKDDKAAASPGLLQQFKRLCRIDPVAAHEVWPQ